jgi:hypothetical protein
LATNQKRATGIPKQTKRQQQVAKTNCQKFYRRKTRLKILIIDAESYVPFDPKDVSGPQIYSSKDNSKVPDEVRFKTKDMFYKKYLV